MFCKKCGQQLPDGTRFCQKCGAPTGAAQNPAPQRPVNPQMRPQTPPQRPMNPQMRPQTPPQRPANPQARPMQRPQPAYAPANAGGYLGQFKNKLGPAMIGYFVLLVLTLVCFIIMANSPLLKVSGYGESATATFAELVESEEMEPLDVISTVLSIVAFVLLLLPFVPKIRLSAPLMILARITYLWNTFWCILFWCYYADKADSVWYSGLDFGPTFGCILVILLSIGLLVYSFVLARQNKKYVKAQKQRMAGPAFN